MSRKISLLLAVLMLMTSVISAADVSSADVFVSPEGDVTEIFVDVNGDDSANGSESEPLRTLAGARDRVRQLNDDMKGDIIVHVGEGVFTLDETFVLTDEDSGTNGYKVIYKGRGRENTVISGGITVDGWELHDADKNVYKATVPEGVNTRQLYINGEKAVRARSGKVGVYSTRIAGAKRIKDGEVLPELLTVDNADSRAQADDGTIFIKKSDNTIDSSWAEKSDVELHVFTAWCVNILRIKSVSEEGSNYSIKVADEEAELVFNRQHPNIDGYSHMSTRNFIYYVENAYELIDLDNEWYLDTDENVIYYKAPADMNMNEAKAVIPMLETLVHVSGTLDSRVENVAFTDMGFAYSTWLKPSEEGFVDGQAMQYVTRTTFSKNDVGVGRAAAGILVEAAEGIVFDNCKISNMGATGIDLHYGVVDSYIVNCLVTDISGNGIAVGKFVKDGNVDYHELYDPTDKREICDGVVIVNNEIYRVGKDYECAVSIAAGYPKNILIANNTIAYAPYSGISVGFGWTKSKNAMEGNRIIRNKIYSVTEVLCDAGAIYTLSNQPDSEMWENYIYDIKLPSWADYGTSGIYLDEGTTGYYITGNVIERAYDISSHATGVNQIFGNYVNTSGRVKGDYAEKVKENAGVQSTVDLDSYNDVPDLGSALPELEYTEIFRDDFDSYEDGRLTSDYWNVQKSQRDIITVVSDGENKVIELVSNGSNTKLHSTLELSENVTQFEFCFNKALSGAEGMYNVLRNSGTVYTANLTPAFSTTVRLETKGTDEVGIVKTIRTGKWYVCKTMVYERVMYVKIWQIGEEEPDGWDLMKEMKDPVKNDGALGLEFYATGSKSMYVDNVVVYSLTEKPESDDTTPETEDTDAPVTDTEAPETADAMAQETEKTPPSTEKPKEEKGCGSVLAPTIIVFIAILGSLLFKKETE